MELKENEGNDFMNDMVNDFIKEMSLQDSEKSLSHSSEDAFIIRETMFEEITKMMYNVYKAKNRDYGMSVTDTYEKFGLTSFLVRLSDKLNRLISLDKRKEILVKDEKIEDTLLDLANYAVIALIETRLNTMEESQEDVIARYKKEHPIRFQYIKE